MGTLNKSIIGNTNDLSRDDLIDEYQHLSQRYIDAKQLADNLNQQVYEMRNRLSVVTNNESYLMNELETINKHHEAEVAKLHEKYRMELEQMRKQCQDTITNMESEILNKTQESVKEKEVVTVAIPVNESIIEREQAHLTELLMENSRLMELLNEANVKLMETSHKLLRAEEEIEQLSERCSCFECNLEAKKSELEERDSQNDLLQEQLALLNSELAALKNPAADPGKKGNSLFAEVDDQRQYMKDLLARQKLHYDQMKRAHKDSDRQITALKRENAAMHHELEACTKMFKSAMYLDKGNLEDRISTLNSEVCALQERLKKTEDRMRLLAEDKGQEWVGPMMDAARYATSKLEGDLKSIQMKKFEADCNYFHASEEAARWRFEALQLRCIIIDRELLLEDNKIPFNGKIHSIKEITKQVYKDAISDRINDRKQHERPMITQNFGQKTLPKHVEISNDTADPIVIVESLARRSENVTESEAANTSNIREDSTTDTIIQKLEYEHQIDKVKIEPSPPILADSNENNEINIDHLHSLRPDVNANDTTTISQLQYRPIRPTPMVQNVLKGEPISNTIQCPTNDTTVDNKTNINLSESTCIKNPAPKKTWRVVRVKLEPLSNDENNDISIFPTQLIKTEK